MPSWTTWQSVCFCVLQASWLLSRKVQEVRWDKEQHSLCRLEVMLDESNTDPEDPVSVHISVVSNFDLIWLQLIKTYLFWVFYFPLVKCRTKSFVEHSIKSVTAKVSWSQNIPDNMATWLVSCRHVALATLMLLQHHQYRIVMIVQLFSHRIVLFEGDRTQILVAGLKTTKCQSP